MKKFRTYIINGGDLPQNDFPSSSTAIDINSGDESEEFSDEEEDVQNDEEKTDNKMDVENAKAIDMETKLKLDPNVKVQVTTADESIAKPTNWYLSCCI